MIDLSTLFPPVREMAERVLFSCEKQGIAIRIPDTGLIRNEATQIKIYGHEQWTVHYIGCAVDFEPRLKCKIHEWRDMYNNWPMWNRLQCEIAVSAGFDKPQDWQLKRDRPHCQCLFGIPEQVLRQMWNASLAAGKSDADARAEIWKYISLHLPKPA
jgi:hypothetical protein